MPSEILTSSGIRIRASIGSLFGIPLLSSINVSPTVRISHRIDDCDILVCVLPPTSGVGLRHPNPPNSPIGTYSTGWGRFASG